MVKLFEHFWIKIIAVILGLLLWFHVATEKSYNYQLSLPVTEVVLDTALSLTMAPPDSLTVTVTATGKQLMRQKWRERGLKIIANHYTAGRHNVQLTTSNILLESPISDLSLDEILFPVNVAFIIDKVITAKKKVKADIITIPGDGFAVGSISTPEPSEVSISGPRSVLRRISDISTERKELKGLRNNLNVTLSLVTPAEYGLHLETDSVIVAIEVVPVKTRLFEQVPVVIYNLPANQNVTVDPAFISVELTGSPDKIDSLSVNAIIVSGDYKLKNEYGKTGLKIVCPPNFNVKKASTNAVTLTLE